MERHRYERLVALFEQAQELPAGERSAFLCEQCADDAGLRAQAEAMLRFDAAPSIHLKPAALSDVLDLDELADTLGAPPERIGRYRILRRLGDGGMGSIFEAEQEAPQRLVALKVVRTFDPDARSLRRFHREVRLLGRLQHRGIARIYDADSETTAHGTLPYFAMELIRGLPLLGYAASRRLGIRDRLELMLQVCDAVCYAHGQGVVHRDLKPDNIYVDEFGQCKILDFGVARAMDADGTSNTLHTLPGGPVGTIAYMSPEQAGGRSEEIDERSDVYSLGVVLYEILGLKRPLDVQGLPLADALRVIRYREPERLGAVDKRLRGDLEVITAKALEKDRNRRYASAEELASDIRRFLADEPILARPVSTAYQLLKLARRNRSVTAGLGLVFAALLVVSFGAIAFASYKSSLLAEAQERSAAAESKEMDARRLAYFAHLASALSSLEQGYPLSALESMGAAPEGFHYWAEDHIEARLAQELDVLEGIGGAVECFAVSPDEREVVVGLRTAEGAPSLQHWSLAEKRLLRDIPLHRSGVQALDFSPTGEYFASGGRGGVLAVWDADSDEVLWSQVDDVDLARHVAFSPDGTKLAVNHADGLVRVYAVESSEVVAQVAGAGPVAFDPSGSRLAVQSAEALGLGVLLYDLESQRVVSEFKGPDHYMVDLVFNSDGSMLHGASWDRQVWTWSAETGEVRKVRAGHRGKVLALDVSEADGTLVSASEDGTLCYWAQDAPGPRSVLFGHEGSVTEVAFLSGGRRVLSASHDGTLKIWDRTFQSQQTTLQYHEGYVYGLDFAPDGRRLLTASWDRTARIWDLDLCEVAATIEFPEAVTTARFDRSGDRILLGGVGGLLRIYDSVTQELLAEPEAGAQRIARLDLDASHGLLAAACFDGMIRIWDSTSLEPVRTLRHSEREVSGLAFSPDGKYLASCGYEGTVQLWDPMAGTRIAELRSAPGQVMDHTTAAWCVEFSADGKLLAAGDGGGVIQFWDVESRELVRETREHASPVYAVAFSPDGRCFASAGDDQTVRVRSLEGPAISLDLRGHESYVFALGFSPDGTRLASASGDGTVRIWDAKPLRTRARVREEASALRERLRPEVRSLIRDSGGGRSAAAELRAAGKPGDRERDAALLLLLQESSRQRN